MPEYVLLVQKNVPILIWPSLMHYIAPTEKDDEDIAQEILAAIHLLEENGYKVSKKKEA